MRQFQSYFSQQTWNSLQRKTEPAQKKEIFIQDYIPKKEKIQI